MAGLAEEDSLLSIPQRLDISVPIEDRECALRSAEPACDRLQGKTELQYLELVINFDDISLWNYSAPGSSIMAGCRLLIYDLRGQLANWRRLTHARDPRLSAPALCSMIRSYTLR